MISAPTRSTRGSSSWPSRKPSTSRSRTRPPKRSKRSRTPSSTSRRTPRKTESMSRLSSPRRVAVTGVGLVSPLGVGNRENWEGLTAGRSGLGPITRFDASRFACRIAGEVKGFDPSLFIEKKEIKKMDIFIHYGGGGGHFAMEDSGVPVTDANRERFAVVVGSGIGGLPIIEETQRKYV